MVLMDLVVYDGLGSDWGLYDIFPGFWVLAWGGGFRLWML